MCTQKIMKRFHPLRNISVRLITGVFLLALLTACAPTLYSIDVKYTGATAGMPAGDTSQQSVVTVAAFNDTRPGGEDLQIGRVTTAIGGLTTVVPKNLKPSAAVSAIVKDVLVKSGYQVTLTTPGWNLQENAIQKEWGRIIVGGNINELDMLCQNDIPIKTYEARVKLTIYIADAQTGKIITQVVATSNNSLEHVYFSEDMMGQQISGAITEAVEKALSGETQKKMQAILKQNP
jgi:hypothetical protein